MYLAADCPDKAMHPKTLSLKLGRQVAGEPVLTPHVESEVQPPPLPPLPPSAGAFYQANSATDLSPEQILAELV
jgi:hypothetical protein